MKPINRLITVLFAMIMSLTILIPTTVFATGEISAEVTKSKTISMKDYMGDISGKTLIWSSSNSKIATVNSNGVAKGTGVGQCTITAKTKDGSFSASVLLNVTQIYETGIKLSKSKVSLNKGKTVTLKATLSPSNTDFKTVTWDSDNYDIATVSSNGVVKAINTGTCAITATSTNGKSTACIVTVLPQKVTAVKMGKTASTYSVGQNVNISLSVNPASADNRAVNWTSRTECRNRR